MNILNTIIDYKKKEIQNHKELVTTKRLEKSLFFGGKTVSLSQYLRRPDKVGIIAEIKRSSPSKGIINDNIDVERLSISYMQSGASALSVLTDSHFFGGSNKDLQIARKYNFCPILRKDFIIDEYQILEAKSIGADCILLIATCLTPSSCKQLVQFAKSLHLEVLLEVHNKIEIQTHYDGNIDLIGVNNRDLKTFNTDIKTSLELYDSLPKEAVKVSESGIKNGKDIKILKECGFDGFLIGGYFMSKSEPSLACKEIIEDYQNSIR